MKESVDLRFLFRDALVGSDDGIGCINILRWAIRLVLSLVWIRLIGPIYVTIESLENIQCPLI